MPATVHNPYAPPSSHVVRAASVAKGSIPIVVASGVLLTAFLAFTIMLLRSSGADYAGGKLFICNTPFLAGLTIASFWSTRIGALFGLAAVAGQMCITVVMLLVPIGEAAPVLLINSAVILPVFAVSAWAGIRSRRQRLFAKAAEGE